MNRSKRVLLRLSNIAVLVGLKVGFEKDGLLCLGFHSVLNDIAAKQGVLLPALGMPLPQYRVIFESLLEAGYVFVSSDQISNGLPTKGKFAHISFDDGYFNNVEILPLLKEYHINAQIFVATSFVQENKKYWWDVVYQQMSGNGANESEISSEISRLKFFDPEKIEIFLKDRFGPSAILPTSDADRPLAPDELQALSKSPLITIGNHTRDHILMDRTDVETVRSQVIGAQNDLEKIIGYRPRSFAYPNGNYNNDAVSVLRASCFDIAFTTDFRVNNLKKDLRDGNRLTLGRFFFLSKIDPSFQCRNFRVANISPLVLAKKLKRQLGN
jgi:peptidoglycan/xylan/chitin deacetylase (PgdA/CDA1 family)